jgi:hypothetical protein
VKHRLLRILVPARQPADFSAKPTLHPKAPRRRKIKGSCNM